MEQVQANIQIRKTVGQRVDAPIQGKLRVGVDVRRLDPDFDALAPLCL